VLFFSPLIEVLLYLFPGILKMARGEDRPSSFKLEHFVPRNPYNEGRNYQPGPLACSLFSGISKRKGAEG
jgi:hypothetical protein